MNDQYFFYVFPLDIDLSHIQLKSSDDKIQMYHKFIEASKFAFALRSYIGDVDTAEVQEVSVGLAYFYFESLIKTLTQDKPILLHFMLQVVFLLRNCEIGNNGKMEY